MDQLKIIGKNIVRIRKEQEITQEDLCGKAQIDRSYLSEVENGKMNLTVKALEKIANALNVDIISFFNIDNILYDK